jgi:hypothetical protein
MGSTGTHHQTDWRWRTLMLLLGAIALALLANAGVRQRPGNRAGVKDDCDPFARVQTCQPSLMKSDLVLASHETIAAAT